VVAVKVLVAGASGFVGRRLCPALAGAGHEVVAMTRSPAGYAGAGTPVHGDVHHPGTLAAAMTGCEAAYYLVHSLADADFERKDAAAAAFGQAGARAGLHQIIYLEMPVIEPGAARCRAPVPGDLGGARVTDVHDDHLLAFTSAAGADPDRLPQQRPGHRVLAALEGHHRGLRCHGPGHAERDRVRRGGQLVHRACSSASMSAGTRRVTRCARVLTCPQNSAHAASSPANEAYSPSRFTSFGTRPAFASFTVLPLPPSEAGSAGSHVSTVTE
jgi:NAD(P)-dependent dehydrogenase (short-subunit alcohol dehydrogenase family)